MSGKLPRPPVLVVTDRHQLDGGIAAMGAMADAVFASGIRWISLREKDLSVEEQIALVVDFKRRAIPYGGCVSVHGSPEIAVCAGADGVHLPEGADAAAARALLGEEALIGQSAHSINQVQAADPRYLDYLIVGPAFVTQSKPGYGPALGETGLRAMVKGACLPVIAIGGIDHFSAPICLHAGVTGIAVMGGAMRAQDRQVLLSNLLNTLAE